jgi:tetratricopeptide (TPR) repeat protein
MESMQKIPLRVFYRTIDELIINQQSDAAISRTKYLLQIFPKNLSLYRLLGKAFLDNQDFDNARIVFSKILTIDPDDFVSHIGLSIIYQDAGDLDKAEESMLRAYELQPSNEQLQSEIKRIHKALTGTELVKIRMTRGTLIKMYSRSQLADQTIAEARLGIQESPDRIDYKIHLAKMLDFSDKDIDSIQTCMDIIQVLPYCYEALLILNKRISNNNKSESSSLFRSRLSELDPYFSFMKFDTKSVEDIPDITIMVEEKSKPDENFGNLAKFINDQWEISSSEQEALKLGNLKEDWNSIINNAISNEGLGAPINDLTYEEVIIPSKKDVDGINEIIQSVDNSKFMLEGNEIPSEDKINSDGTTNMASNDLVLSSDEIISNSEIIKETTKKDPSQKINIGTPKNRLKDILKTKSNPQDESKDVPMWALDKNEEVDFSKEKSKFSEKLVTGSLLPSDFGSDGMTDHNSPINTNLESLPMNTPETLDWITEKQANTGNGQTIITPKLDDTQRIYIISEKPEEIMEQAFNSIEIEDYSFAHLCFSKLLQNDFQLIEVAERLETLAEDNPNILDLWLILAEVYKKIGLEEKTLSALVRAQNNLSFH